MGGRRALAGKDERLDVILKRRAEPAGCRQVGAGDPLALSSVFPQVIDHDAQGIDSPLSVVDDLIQGLV